MRYKCLVFDHDDTDVNSTATIHHPCFEQYLRLRYPGRHCTLEEYFLKNFDPGFMQMCQNEYGMDDAALQDETEFWKKYVAQHIPSAYPGMNELMCRHKAEGGYICVVSHSFDENIRRDYAENGLPEPDLVLYLDMPTEQAVRLLRSREASTHTKGDIHEVDTGYLALCRKTALRAADCLGWVKIPCVLRQNMASNSLFS